MTLLFEKKFSGANIETSTLDAREKLEKLILDENEQTVSLDVKSPVLEAIEIALRKLYRTDYAPDFKVLLKLAVTKVYFKSNGKGYCQKDGLAMGASLAVISANLWMQLYEQRMNDKNDGIKQIT